MDWEEARAEFFQETYPSESLNSSTSTEVRRNQQQETRLASNNGSSVTAITAGAASSFRDASVGTLESRSSRISIHLNRTASTTPADAISPSGDEASPPSVVAPSSKSGTHNRATKSRMRAAVQGLEEEESDEGEIEVVDFTDENLATEVESWQNQKRLRDLAVPLSQKKTLRLQYEKCPKIKLARLRAIRFACTRFAHWLWNLRASFCRRLIRWGKPLACVDRHRGGEMFAGLQIHKILAFLTAIIGLTVLSFLLLPYLLFVCNFSLQECHFLEESGRNNSMGNEDESLFLWNWQRHGQFFFYSFFISGSVEAEKQQDFNFEEYFPLIYLLVNVICQVGIGLYLLNQLVILIRGVTGDETADTWFKSIFASWNHNMVCQTSSTLKHRSIYKQIKQKIQLARSPTKAKTFCTRCLVVAARCLSLLFTLVVWASIMALIHLSALIQLKSIDELLPANLLEYLPPGHSWQRQASEALVFYLPVVLIIVIRFSILPLARLLDKWEYYPFNARVVAYSCRLFVSRAVGLFTLVTTLFHLHQGSCWEDHFCHQMLALAVMDFAADIVLTLIIRFPRVLLASLCQRRWSCSTKLDYDPYETVVDLVMDLALMVLGLLYCPLLPFIILAKLSLGYGLRLFHIWVNCSASRDTHSPSCIRFLFVGFSSVMLLFASVVFVYALLCNPVTPNYGPFQNYQSLSRVLPYTWHKITGDGQMTTWNSDKGLSPAAITAYILAALIAVLLFGLYISHLKRLSIERDANELKCQLAIATQEKCYLIAKIKRPSKPQTATT